MIFNPTWETHKSLRKIIASKVPLVGDIIITMDSNQSSLIKRHRNGIIILGEVTSIEGFAGIYGIFG